MPRFFVAAIAIAAFSFLVLQTGSASAHGWIVDDGCGPGSSGYFWAAGPSGYWFDDDSDGYGGCFMFTPNIYSNPSPPYYRNWAEWYLPAESVEDPEDYDHYYGIWVNVEGWVCEYPAVGWGHYHRWRYGHYTSNPTQHVWWDQDGNCDGLYNVHTGYFCNETYGGLWDMQDYTYDDDDSYFIIVDMVLFNPHNPTHGC